MMMMTMMMTGATLHTLEMQIGAPYYVCMYVPYSALTIIILIIRFAALQRGTVKQITNSDLSDIQWTQASLPVRDGGLGIRRVSSLALPAFVASAASTLSPGRHPSWIVLSQTVTS